MGKAWGGSAIEGTKRIEIQLGCAICKARLGASYLRRRVDETQRIEMQAAACHCVVDLIREAGRYLSGEGTAEDIRAWFQKTKAIHG